MHSVAFEERHPVNAYLFRGHLDEHQVRESLEDELGDKEQVDRIMRNTTIAHTYGKPLPRGNWWLTNAPEPKHRCTPVTIVG
ncbi:hypothetical protein SHab15497_00057 [Acinetobacter phage SH-Ab 15497]|nr:hypothetical protein SHab15497_00057 [Acinetobacter phage SH-Ab 15497]